LTVIALKALFANTFSFSFRRDFPAEKLWLALSKLRFLRLPVERRARLEVYREAIERARERGNRQNH
jgi:hypothetical protein